MAIDIPPVNLGRGTKGNTVSTLGDGDTLYVATLLDGRTARLLRWSPATGWQARDIPVPYDTQAVSVAAYLGRIVLTPITLASDGNRVFGPIDTGHVAGGGAATTPAPAPTPPPPPAGGAMSDAQFAELKNLIANLATGQDGMWRDVVGRLKAHDANAERALAVTTQQIAALPTPEEILRCPVPDDLKGLSGLDFDNLLQQLVAYIFTQRQDATQLMAHRAGEALKNMVNDNNLPPMPEVKP